MVRKLKDIEERLSEAQEIVMRKGNVVSAKYLMDAMDIKASEAARLLEILEEKGIVGPPIRK